MNATISRLFWCMAAVVMILPGCRDGSSNAPISRGPMVQMVTASNLSVTWKAPRGSKQSLVATANGSETPLNVDIDRLRTGRHVAMISGLAANTAITYRILDAEKNTLAEHKTTTAPPSIEETPTPFSFIAFGDSGMGNEAQYQLAEAMKKFNPRLIVHTGDLIYPDGETSDYPAKFYQPYAEFIATAPFYPCIGNHDYHSDQGGPLFDEFELPRNGPEGEFPERHYWFDYGCVRFVALDSNLSKQHIDDKIVPWLDRVLKADGPHWKIVFFHHPVYSNAHYGPTRKLWDKLVPCLEKHRVNLVLNGHDHLYERTHPLKAQKIVPNGQGVVYITTGAGGAKLYPPRSEPMEEIEVATGDGHSFTVIDVSADVLQIQQIGSDGKVLDEFTIEKWTTQTISLVPTTESQ